MLRSALYSAAWLWGFAGVVLVPMSAWMAYTGRATVDAEPVAVLLFGAGCFLCRAVLRLVAEGV